MLRDGKISGLFVMVTMFIGITAVILLLTRLILSKFKVEKDKTFKYDASVTILMIVALNSFYIKFFANQLIQYKGMEYIPIIIITSISLVIPYNIIVALICGVKKKVLFLTAFLSSIFNIITIALVGKLI